MQQLHQFFFSEIHALYFQCQWISHSKLSGYFLRYGNNYFCKPPHFQLKRVIWAPILTASFRKHYHKIWNCRDRRLLMVQTSLVSVHSQMTAYIQNPIPTTFKNAHYYWRTFAKIPLAHKGRDGYCAYVHQTGSDRKVEPSHSSGWQCQTADTLLAQLSCLTLQKSTPPPERTTITPLSFFFPESQLTNNNCN